MIMAETRTNVRMPEELYEEIKRIAARERRSINQQIVVLIEQGIVHDDIHAQSLLPRRKQRDEQEAEP